MSDAILEDKRHNASARAIKTSGAHLLAVVNDILDLARAEVGGLDIEPCEVDFVQALEELGPTITGLARAGALELTMSIPSDLPNVSADPQRLREILLNLIDNAVKYTPPGGKISLIADVSDGSVSISVRDSGPGIPKEVGDQIFEPFYRVKGTKVQKGRSSSGLGLALTKRLVEAHGGSIGYREGPGQGTTFTFTLPLFESSRSHPEQGKMRESVIKSADVRSAKV